MAGVLMGRSWGTTENSWVIHFVLARTQSYSQIECKKNFRFKSRRSILEKFRLKNVITISEYIHRGEQCRYEIFNRESDENNLDLEFFICQSAASKNYRSKISIYIDHWDYLI